MDRISDKRKSMAALAVFRDLFRQKKDIYDVISEFVKLAIVVNRLTSFDLQKIANVIKHDNGIDIPVAVVKRSVERLTFLIKDGSRYMLNPTIPFDAEQISNDTRKEDLENQYIINKLIDFCEKKKGEILSEEDKSTLCNEFCAFVIDDTNAPIYGANISEFIIMNSKDKDFIEQMNQIRQGVLIFVAFNYNTNYASIDKIDTPLNIYLDTEILFYVCGLNGPVYKNLFDEFYELIAEINKKAKKKIIRLLYFSENEAEITSYFSIAERIVRKEEGLEPLGQAMKNIVNGCVDPYEVIEKKADFFNTLKDKEIILDSQERYYDKEVNYPYLIDSKKFYENKEEGVSDNDIDRKVNLLNYISIKRGFKSQAIFRNVGHILLSANKITFNIAFDPAVHVPNTIPLATSLTFLTNRFWISLNKGLTNIANLKSIDIITKAQIALSAKINDNVCKLYNQYLKEDEQGKYDVEKSKACLAELHRAIVNPDDLTADKAEDYVDILNVNDIESYIAEKSLLEAQMRDDNERMKRDYQELQRLKEAEDLKHEKEHRKEMAAIEKAAAEVLSIRNRERETQYQIALEAYHKNVESEKKVKYTKIKTTNIRRVVTYTMIIIILYIVSVICARARVEECWVLIVETIVGLFLFALPFIRPLVKHRKIAEAYKFCFCRMYRQETMLNVERECKRSISEPKLSLYKIEEIIAELMRE